MNTDYLSGIHLYTYTDYLFGMTTRISISLPENQREFLRTHRNVRPSWILQREIAKLMEKEESK